MHILSKLLISLIAALHCYILWFEMFAWTTKGPKIFSTLPSDIFEPTIAMAANQGLYNGFLAAGLIWSLFIKDARWQKNIAIFFLICVGIAGVYGSMTVSATILFVQTVPAILAMASLFIKGKFA